MADLAEIVDFLERELKVSTIEDYPGAVNGLQLTNEGQVERIIAAVDASLPVIQAAVRSGTVAGGGPAAAGSPGLLIVHHGMFWQGAQPLTGPFYQKIRTAMRAGLAVYSSHLPLDIHPVWGNNMQLAKAIGLTEIEPFFGKKGVFTGVCGSWPGSRIELTEKLRELLGMAVHLCPGGPERPGRVGLITGAAGSEVAKVASYGVDTFITGEGPHWSYPLAEELGVNLFYGGHYATETFGVRAIVELLAGEFGLPWSFVDHPTGL